RGPSPIHPYLKAIHKGICLRYKIRSPHVVTGKVCTTLTDSFIYQTHVSVTCHYFLLLNTFKDIHLALLTHLCIAWPVAILFLELVFGTKFSFSLHLKSGTGVRPRTLLNQSKGVAMM